MKFLNQILLIFIFLCIETNRLNAFLALCLIILLASVWIKDKKGKLRVPLYFIIAFCVYTFFLVLGIINGHSNITIDVKFQIFGFIFYLILINLKEFNLLRFLFILNAIISAVYIFLSLGIIPSIWNDILTGMGGRVYGPSIIPIVIIQFVYLYKRRSFDMPLALSWLLALVYLLFTSNLMNLMIAAALLFLIVVDIRKLLKPVFIFGFSILIGGFILFFNSDFAPEAIKTKLPYILKPSEYASLKIRIDDFNKALRKENFNLFEKIIGEGFGTSTTIYRKNEKAPSLSGNFTFLEIDNGFYYLYHRGGFLLLLIFLLINFYLFLKLKPIKAKLGFVAIVVFTCLLSIHYFINMFYLIIPFLIMEGYSKRNDVKHEQLEV